MRRERRVTAHRAVRMSMMVTLERAARKATVCISIGSPVLT
jgi:hypothetical protein